MRVLSIDPGERPGFVELDETGRVLAANHVAIVGVWDLVIFEGQWWTQYSNKDPNRLFTLANRAGWQAALACAASAQLGGAGKLPRVLRLTPQVWRGSTSLAKAQLQRQIAKSLSVDERRVFAGVPKSRHGDVLDAIGLGRKGVEIALAHPNNDSEFEWPPELATKRKRIIKK